MFSTFGRHMSEEEDRYDPGYAPHSHATFSSAPLNTSMAAFHLPRTTQDLPASMAGFEMNFTDAPGWGYSHNAMSPPMYHEEGVSSNISTASAPSAPSSAVGSPQPMYGQPAPHQDWTHGVLSPGIVDPSFAATGMEYSSFTQPGVEDLAAYGYDTTKQPGFVSKSPQHLLATSSQSQQPPRDNGSPSPSLSRRKSSCTTPSESGLAAGTPTESVYSQNMRSPISPESSRHPSISTHFGPSTPLSPTTAPGWTSPATPRVPPFFSQSSGHFIAPLVSSCRFFLLQTSSKLLVCNSIC